MAEVRWSTLHECRETVHMTHVDFITSIARTVREAGSAAALEALREAHADMPGTGPALIAYHDTLAVFYVWAVDRLIDAGLSDSRILWHPLTDPLTPLSWWDAATLASHDARDHFVPSTRALPGEPAPCETQLLIAA